MLFFVRSLLLDAHMHPDFTTEKGYSFSSLLADVESPVLCLVGSCSRHHRRYTQEVLADHRWGVCRS